MYQGTLDGSENIFLSQILVIGRYNLLLVAMKQRWY